MKKILFFATLLLSVVFVTSCSKDDIENTATVNLAGDWYVTVDAVDDNGNTVFGDADLFGLGRIHMLTYNTSNNVPNELYVEDEGNFWTFKVKTTSDANALTFSTNGPVQNEGVFTSGSQSGSLNDIQVNISDGKIVKNGGVQKNGSVTDSISFYVTFSDDQYPAQYGYAKYHVHGVRYSGLVDND